MPCTLPAPLQVCSGPALTLFNPTELELLICGLPHLDFEQLEAAAQYEGGYSRWAGRCDPSVSPRAWPAGYAYASMHACCSP
jgi:hypothetical protein